MPPVPESKSKRSRYTPPPPKKPPPSPTWYVAVVFVLFVGGLVVIVGNYVGILPGTAQNAKNSYLVGGLASILIGFLLTMRLR